MKEFFKNYLEISDIIAKNKLFTGMINPCIRDTEEGFKFMKYIVRTYPQYFSKANQIFCYKTLSFQEKIREQYNEKTNKIYKSLIVKIEHYFSNDENNEYYDSKTTVIYEIPKRRSKTWIESIMENDYKYVAIFSEWLPTHIDKI